ncbi:MAG TPA: serine hydrolase [Planctomycetota bacterium]
MFHQRPESFGSRHPTVEIPMHVIRSTPLLTAVLAWLSPAQAQVQAYHEVTSAQHQAQVQALTNAGYRMISLSLYGTPGSPRYAAVWVQRNGPSFVPFQDLTSAQYQAFLNSHLPTHVPTLVTAAGSGNNARFAGVLEQTGYGAWASHGLTAEGLKDAVADARNADWRLCSADVYGTGADPRYIVCFKPNPQQVGWGYYRASGVQDHQDKFDGMKLGYGRQIVAAFNDDSSQFLSCWEDTLVGGGPVHHDMTAASYNTYANQYWSQNNQYPINVCASGSGSGARFSAIFASTDLPASRQWTMTGTVVPQLGAFDVWMQNLMQGGGIHGAQLAIVKDGKLKFARGYTWAEAGYPTTQPTSLFRIASCSKPLTSIAIHRVMQQNPQFNYQTTMASQFGNPNFADWTCNQITIGDLLTHRGGWDSTSAGSGYDPMFWDDTIAQALPATIPVSLVNIRNYMQQQQLDFAPDSQSIYSNYGFCLLGRIVAARNPGKSYTEVIDEQIMQPLGITRPQIGQSHRDQRLPGEVLYHPRVLSVAQSVNDGARPWVPVQYGGWNHPNMDSHGAWVMAAPDFAKVLAAFDLGQFNPLLDPNQTAAMWSPAASAPGSTWLKGWFRQTVPNGQGGTVAMREHNGILPGTRTYIGRRADGLSFVLFTNGDRWLGGPDGLALSNIANGISMWPAHDLFGSVGINPLQFIDDVMSPYGSPCPGSTGTPLLVGSGSAMIGGRASFDLSAVLPGTAALCLFGVASIQADLGFLGAPGCSLAVDPLVMSLVLTGATGTGGAGTASCLLDIPLVPGLVGSHVFGQYAIFDPTANPFGWHLSRGLDVRIGGWLGY